MSSKCDICGKTRSVGHRITRADNRVKRIWKPNIQRIRIVVDGRNVRKNVCTTCIRSGKITRAI
ncbi:MAG: 50S ribosomal protein L28 [Firmicutes bacterium]|nr:50S ribosomal protein L28 [Bacillota bacterium]